MKKHFLTENFYILIAFYAVSIFLANDMFLPAIGEISKEMNVDSNVISYGVGAYLLGALSLQLLAGPLSDKYGRRKALLGGGLFFSLATFGIIFSTTAETFLIFRYLQGAGTCMFSAAGMASLNEYYKEEEAVKAISLTINIIMLAPILGPIVGAFIIKFTSWRGIFIVDLLILLVVLVFIYIFMPETSDTSKTSKYTLKDNFKGLIMVFRNKSFLLHCLSLSSYAGMFIVWITAGVHMFVDNLGKTPQEYSFWQIPVLLMYMLGNSISPKITRRLKSKGTVDYVTRSLTIFILILAGLNVLFDESLWLLLLIVSITMLHRGVINSPYSQYVLSLEREFQGSTASGMSILTNIGSVTASVVASYFYDFSNREYIFLMLGFCILGVIFKRIGDRAD